VSKVARLLVLMCVAALPAAAQPLRVLAFESEPFFYLEGGQPAGLEYEILDYFARAHGRPLEIIWEEQFDALLPGLVAGAGDVAAGTITITPEREAQVDFSSSYFPVRVILVEPEGETTADLRDLAGATLATIAGTTYEEILRPVAGERLIYGADEKELLGLVAAGRARATAMDTVLALAYLPAFPQLHMTLPLSEPTQYGFATVSGSPLAGQLSEHLRQLKLSGIYFRLLDRFLGREAVDMVKAAGR
jgi:ABC-type amino acid transport substrate-binding protein